GCCAAERRLRQRLQKSVAVEITELTGIGACSLATGSVHSSDEHDPPSISTKVALTSTGKPNNTSTKSYDNLQQTQQLQFSVQGFT
ncbi:hypothetical protein, partial [Pseudomonas lini]|uniref:hypothetical protein n=1 Tax=Pseudomonas lini TaxID=163011 RepID=UPI001C9E0048